MNIWKIDAMKRQSLICVMFSVLYIYINIYIYLGAIVPKSEAEYSKLRPEGLKTH